MTAHLGFLGLGFVGLGNIGKPMALRLTGWPGGLAVYDVAPAPLAELGQAGATVAASVAEVAAASDVVSVMVRDDEQVRDVMAQILGAARPGTTVAIHSTVSPDLPARLAAEAAPHRVRVVDAPVSGGATGAHDGTLAILVGGDDEAFGACAEPFALLGSEVVHCGPAGAGTAAKLARNLLHFVAFTAAGEAQRLAEAAGIDLVDLGRVVRHTDAITGGPGAIMHRSTTAPVAPDDGWFGILDHVRALGEKDLDHAIGLAGNLGVDVPMARFARSHLAAALGLEDR
jgi:3-hydroxyisobutyrate dehydrogenase-like beta-hydroxyacid dehydrogenase